MLLVGWLAALPLAAASGGERDLSQEEPAQPFLSTGDAVQLSDPSIVSLLALNRRSILSSCEDGYPRVVVDILLNPKEENAVDMPKQCALRRAYIGIESCSPPMRSRLFRLPDRCAWKAAGPGGFGGMDPGAGNSQPSSAEPGKSAVINLRSLVVDPEGRPYFEVSQVLVSFDDLKVLQVNRRLLGN